MNGSFTIEIVAVKSVDWHDDDNPRVCDNIDARVADLLQSDPDLWEPIVVAPLGGGRYYGIDGYARHTTAKQLGIANLRARVEQLPQDVRDRSFALNRLHGFHLFDRRAQSPRAVPPRALPRLVLGRDRKALRHLRPYGQGRLPGGRRAKLASCELAASRATGR